MKRRTRPERLGTASTPPAAGEATPLRIIGGALARRKLKYSGDLRTRPMKDRVREAVFNLVGPAVAGTHAFDLFAGTGALGIEALSRGAARATFIEQHFPTAQVIRENLAALELTAMAEVVPGNSFIWARRLPESDSRPWVVFCSPPYDFYVNRAEEMADLLARLLAAAPSRSIFVVEADERFDFATLPTPDAWDVRHYPPAHVGILRTQLPSGISTPPA